MTALPVGLENNNKTTTTPKPEITTTTMPSNFAIRNPIGGMNPPFPRPTVSLDPRPVVIPILSSVIGFPIVVFALICALRHRAIKLRRRDQLKKLQAGIRSVTLDIPPREKVSFFSGCSSPDMSVKEVGDKLESFTLKPSLTTSTTRRNTSKNNNHVKFITPPSSAIGVSAITAAAAAATCAPKPCNSATTTVVEVLLHVNTSIDPTRNGQTHWNKEESSNSPSLNSDHRVDMEQDFSSNENSR